MVNLNLIRTFKRLLIIWELNRKLDNISRNINDNTKHTKRDKQNLKNIEFRNLCVTMMNPQESKYSRLVS